MLEALKKILCIPTNAYNIGNEEKWISFEEKLGITLPKDYKDFIDIYGTGGIDNFLWILNPFVEDENVNFLKKKEELLNAYQESKNKFPELYQYNIFPSSEGLLPWGYTDNADELYWLTSEKLEDWKIIIYESRSSENYCYSYTMTEFLYQIVSKEIICDAFSEDFPNENPIFIAVNVK